MFTIDQIKSAHSKVKSGADFAAYIREIKNLGVLGYTFYVADGHTEYFGSNDYEINSQAIYPQIEISATSNLEEFKVILKEHQHGKTDFKTFVAQCAQYGVEKWVVDVEHLKCSYYDKIGNEILVERIPK